MGFGGTGFEVVEDMLLLSSLGSSTSSIGFDHSAMELCSEMSTNEDGDPGLVPEGARDGVDEIFYAWELGKLIDLLLLACWGVPQR